MSQKFAHVESIKIIVNTLTVTPWIIRCFPYKEAVKRVAAGIESQVYQQILNAYVRLALVSERYKNYTLKQIKDEMEEYEVPIVLKRAAMTIIEYYYRDGCIEDRYKFIVMIGAQH
jgi:hypothetical protein